MNQQNRESVINERRKALFNIQIRDTAAGKRGKENMGEFKVINTQEEFDAAIKDRITRAEQTAETRVRAELKKDLDKVTTLEENVKNLTSEREGLTKKIETLESQNAENEKKLKTYEMDALKLKIAQESGIPISERNRLTGETEEDIRKDAESFAKVFKAANNQGLPGFEQNEGVPSGEAGEKRAELKSLLGKIRKGDN